jgi:HEAT repeat protein
LLECLKDRNSQVRDIAALSLGHIGKYPEKVVPALLNCLAAETNGLASPLMISALGRFGTNARPWSPLLKQMIETNRFGFYTSAAINALDKVDPESAEPLKHKFQAISGRP